jgi:hypothetical protein
MKFTLFAVSLMLSLSSFAGIIASTKNNKINVARIDKVITLVNKPEIKVNIVVEDLGGSTDVSATQKTYFTLYSKGEMFSTDATFDLGPIMELKDAKRVAGGVYQLTVLNEEMKSQLILINAVSAINKIKNVKCDDFDCEASTNFSASIGVVRK